MIHINGKFKSWGKRRQIEALCKHRMYGCHIIGECFEIMR